MKPPNENKLKDPMEFDIDPESNLRAININMGKEIPQDYNPEEADYGDNENEIMDKDIKTTNMDPVNKNSFIDKILMKLGF